ncbi:DNA polymerase III subunit gamma/tau [Ligilactobacillus saerimneri]|uniref:DNA polymerase III subunit gamma/tau n=1 Tax=Ligilactobacillus saerimneri TaxID=228229 RepID=UPI00041E0BF8|nr:DNA polymerase III subunit gamma/tau [Ligilactobacillus saerimneri]KRL73034.1 DNA polymerase III subunits gamma and tau [Ligilactobacillus saerimneri DSM 16049]
MSYQALYRVWRPQRFADLVGQELITKTLRNALVTKQTSHAYLFCGPRGTGKTSAAKIFAKAINCHQQKDGEPCNECETCRAITAGRLNDVIEIDAASNNGVEEIRDIRDKVKYAPTQADYKVYIIDEVHMLSTGAFNALLKTLEEPPANVIFILATTEPHKIPATIISRTQRFDFKRITLAALLHRMEYILQQKEIKYDQQALQVIAKAAEGGMRDALSILDQVLSFGENEVTLDNALLVTGSVTRQELHNYLAQVLNHDTAAALITIQKLLQDGKDPSRLIEDLIMYCRDLLLYQEAPEIVEANRMGVIDDSFKEFAQATAADRLYQMIDVLNEQQENMRFTTHQSVYLEVMTVKLTQASQMTPKQAPVATMDTGLQTEIKQLQQEVATLKQELNRRSQPGATVTEVNSQVKPQAVTRKPIAKIKVDLERVYSVLRAATREDKQAVTAVWDQVLSQLAIPQRAIMSVAQPLAAAPNQLLLGFKQSFLCKKAIADEELQVAVTKQLELLLGREFKLVFIPQDQWLEIRTAYVDQLHKGKQKSQVTTSSKEEAPTASQPEAPLVAEANKIFGEDIVKVKND